MQVVMDHYIYASPAEIFLETHSNSYGLKEKPHFPGTSNPRKCQQRVHRKASSEMRFGSARIGVEELECPHEVAIRVGWKTSGSVAHSML